MQNKRATRRVSPYLDNDLRGGLDAVVFGDLVDVVAVQPVEVEDLGELEHGLNVDAVGLDDHVVVLRFGSHHKGAFDLGHLVDHGRFGPSAQRARHVHFLRGQRHLNIRNFRYNLSFD